MQFKRKKKAGPSKNQKKVQRREYDGSGGPALGQVHPEVSHITLTFSIASPQNAVIAEETRSFSPSDVTDFYCGCPGTCGVGKFDLREKIGEMIEAQTPSRDISETCKIEGFGGNMVACGYILTCRVDITY